MERSSNRPSSRGGQKGSLEAFDEAPPEALEVLGRFLERDGLRCEGLFAVRAAKNEVDELASRLEREGLRCALGRETSVFAAANLLDLRLGRLVQSAVPMECVEAVGLALVQGAERDRVRFLRRLFATLAPGHRAAVQRLAALVAALRAKHKSNKISNETLNGVFAYPLCHARNDAQHSELSASLLDAVAKHHQQLFGKKFDEFDAARDAADFPAPFLSAVRSACDQFAASLLPVPDASAAARPRESVLRLTARASRKSTLEIGAPVIKPITSKGETNKVKASPLAKELGKLLYEGKFGAAKKFVEKKTKELLSQPKEGSDAVILTAEGTYTGPKQDGKPHGVGKLQCSNGDVFEGTFVSGSMTGSGVLSTADGGVFRGNFLAGKLQGQGRFDYANGDSYEGSFADDAFHGFGKYVSALSVYEGGFENGLRSGKGLFKTAQFTYSGEYRDDQMSGLGIYTFANGDEYRGEFSNSLFHGKGIFTAKNGQMVDGVFVKGRFAGPLPTTVGAEEQMRCVACNEVIDSDCAFCPFCGGKQ